MLLVKYTFQGDLDAPETGMSSAFQLSEESLDIEGLTLAALRNTFPFQGVFHFRAKKEVPTKEGYVWMDLVDENEPLQLLQEGNIIEVKVLPISYGEDETQDETQTCDFRWEPSDVKAIPLRDRGERIPFQQHTSNRTKERPKPFSEDSAAFSASDSSDNERGSFNLGRQLEDVHGKALEVTQSVGRRAKAWLGKLARPRPAFPSPEATRALKVATEYLSTPFDPRNSKHEKMLYKFWAAIFPDTAYRRSGNHWKQVGFVNADPILDLKGAGLLGLKSLADFAGSEPLVVQDMIARQSSGGRTAYPFGVVAKNVALMLADVLHLKGQEYTRSKEVYWVLFEDNPGAFQELYTLAFRILDKEWTESQATRDQFSSIIRQTRSHIEYLLSQGLPSTYEIQQMAVDSNLLYDIVESSTIRSSLKKASI